MMAGWPWISIGALLCALSVAAGAFGAHALESRLDGRSLELWETGARYLMYCGLAVMLSGLAAHRWSDLGFHRGSASLLVGGLIFSGTLGALALGGPRWLGAVTPLGGVLLLLGFLLVSWSALRI